MKQPTTKPTWAEIRSLSGAMFHSARITEKRNRKACYFRQLTSRAGRASIQINPERNASWKL